MRFNARPEVQRSTKGLRFNERPKVQRKAWGSTKGLRFNERPEVQRKARGLSKRQRFIESWEARLNEMIGHRDACVARILGYCTKGRQACPPIWPPLLATVLASAPGHRFPGNDTKRSDTIRHNTIQSDTIRYNTIQYDTIRYNTI